MFYGCCCCLCELQGSNPLPQKHTHTHTHTQSQRLAHSHCLAGQKIKIVLVADYYCKNAHSLATYPHKAAEAASLLLYATALRFCFVFPFFKHKHTNTHTHSHAHTCSCSKHVSKCVEKEKRKKLKQEKRAKLHFRRRRRCCRSSIATCSSQSRCRIQWRAAKGDLYFPLSLSPSLCLYALPSMDNRPPSARASYSLTRAATSRRLAPA